MHRRQTILLAWFMVSMFTLLGTVSAQSSLVANITREDEHLSSYSSNSYIADLEAGHWTVVIISDSFWDFGNYPRVDFELASSSTVYILVEENSVYSDTSGFYRIGVYDDSHIPGFFESLSFFDIVILISILSILIPIIICVVAIRRSRHTRMPQRRMDTILVEAPTHAVPDDYKGSVQTHGSRTTTVRLPVECPSCGAQVSHESVDWTGPLEAQCNYCGATMRATFERV
jgi:hypothetical protein